jgi:hypothetical protein
MCCTTYYVHMMVKVHSSGMASHSTCAVQLELWGKADYRLIVNYFASRHGSDSTHAQLQMRGRCTQSPNTMDAGTVLNKSKVQSFVHPTPARPAEFPHPVQTAL